MLKWNSMPANKKIDGIPVPSHIVELKKNYELVFNSDEGKGVLEDLERRCHFWSTTNIKGDSHESAYMEGQRSVLLFIKSMLRKDKGK